MTRNLVIIISLLCLPLLGKAQQSFPYPNIPKEIITPQKRANYLVCHYWDSYDFADTTLLHRQEITELGFVNFIDLAKNNVDEDMAMEGFKSLTIRLSGSCGNNTIKNIVNNYFADLAEKYLYNWESTMRDDKLYSLFIQAFTKNVNKDERLLWRLAQLDKNKIGTPPTDIKLTTRSGKETTLSKIKSNYVVIMFYQPDCIECRETIRHLNELKPKKNTQGTVFIAVYHGDDKKLWKKSLLAFPKEWADCYNTDKKIMTDMSYHIRHTPSFYVIDQKEKKILLKDASFNTLMKFSLFYTL